VERPPRDRRRGQRRHGRRHRFGLAVVAAGVAARTAASDRPDRLLQRLGDPVEAVPDVRVDLVVRSPSPWRLERRVRHGQHVGDGGIERTPRRADRRRGRYARPGQQLA
jgi:hypothetical protein